MNYFFVLFIFLNKTHHKNNIKIIYKTYDEVYGIEAARNKKKIKIKNEKNVNWPQRAIIKMILDNVLILIRYDLTSIKVDNKNNKLKKKLIRKTSYDCYPFVHLQ